MPVCGSPNVLVDKRFVKNMSSYNVEMPTPVKHVTEYPLPASGQTHEIIAVPNSNMLLISQQPNSTLVKVALDPETGAPVRAVGHFVGTAVDGLHGLCNSQVYPGMAWATLQFTSQVVLIDPRAGNVDEAPNILKAFTLPTAARGPHVVIEDGPNLWVSAKDGGQVVRIALEQPDPYTVYAVERRPIFVAVHKNSGLVFATEDQSSSIVWIDPNSGETGQLPIPADIGSTPVGMIAGPDGNVWFVLLGGSGGGSGKFGRINSDKKIDWYHLAAGAWSKAAFIHLAWETVAAGNTNASPSLLLLASSMADSSATNAVVRVTFDSDMSAVDTEAAAVLPTANCMTHRVAATERGWYVTELGACQIAHISSNWTGTGLEAIDEANDYFSDFGMGARSRTVEYR